MLTEMKRGKLTLILAGERVRPPLAPGANTPASENFRGKPEAVGREKAFSMKM